MQLIIENQPHFISNYHNVAFSDGCLGLVLLFQLRKMPNWKERSLLLLCTSFNKVPLPLLVCSHGKGNSHGDPFSGKNHLNFLPFLSPEIFKDSTFFYYYYYFLIINPSFSLRNCIKQVLCQLTSSFSDIWKCERFIF